MYYSNNHLLLQSNSIFQKDNIIAQLFCNKNMSVACSVVVLTHLDTQMQPGNKNCFVIWLTESSCCKVRHIRIVLTILNFVGDFCNN